MFHVLSALFMICTINQTCTKGWDMHYYSVEKNYDVEFSSSKMPIMTLF
jgi:hypothetical protein